MDTTLRFRRRHALHTMNAAFVTQFSKNGFARNSEDRFFQAAEFRGTRFEVFGFQAGRFSIAMVHAVKVGSENGGFASACSSTNFQDSIALFIFIRRHQGDLNISFKIGYPLFELRNLIVSHGCDLNIA